MTSAFILQHVAAAAAASSEDGMASQQNLGPSPLFPWQHHYFAQGVGGSGDQAQRRKRGQL